MYSTEGYKNLQITTLRSEYWQGILQFPNCISYKRFSNHDNDFPNLQNCNCSDNNCTRNSGTGTIRIRTTTAQNESKS